MPAGKSARKLNHGALALSEGNGSDNRCFEGKQQIRIELIINMKTGKALGLTFPLTLTRPRRRRDRIKLRARSTASAPPPAPGRLRPGPMARRLMRAGPAAGQWRVSPRTRRGPAH